MFSYEIFPDYRLCVFTGREQVDVEQIKTASRQMLADERWMLGYNVLYDLRTCSLIDFSYDEIRFGVTKDSSFNDRVEGAKVAIVADRAVTYGFMRMWQILSEHRPLEIKVFREIAEALDFLGVDESIALSD
ncbi:MAG: hypothetical protein JXR84_13080 [Anaerolineae bacterium]|nr:hypothetical protein [Anaerolineae bacterium]